MISQETIQFQLDWIDDLVALMQQQFQAVLFGATDLEAIAPELQEKVMERRRQSLASHEVGMVMMEMQRLLIIVKMITDDKQLLELNVKKLAKGLPGIADTAKWSLAMPVDDIMWGVELHKS